MIQLHFEYTDIIRVSLKTDFIFSSFLPFFLINSAKDRLLCQDQFEFQTKSVVSKVIPSTATVVINHVSIWAE